MEKIDKIYKKIHPGYFAFIGVIIFMIGLIPAMLVESDFSFFVTHMAWLGTPTNSLHIFFNVFWFISAIFQIIFFVGFTRYLQEKGIGVKKTWITLILSVLSAIGLMGMAIFVGMTLQAYAVYIIFVLIFYIMGILYLFSYAFVEWRSSGFSIVQALFNIIVAIFFIINFILLIANFGPGPNVIFPEAYALTGWLFLFAYLIWFLENGIYILLKK